MRSSRLPAARRSGCPLPPRKGVFPHSLVCGAPAWLPPPQQLPALPLHQAPAVHSSRLGVGVGNSWSAPGKRGLGWKGTQLGGLRGDQLPELLLAWDRRYSFTGHKISAGNRSSGEKPDCWCAMPREVWTPVGGGCRTNTLEKCFSKLNVHVNPLGLLFSMRILYL